MRIVKKLSFLSPCLGNVMLRCCLGLLSVMLLLPPLVAKENWTKKLCKLTHPIATRVSFLFFF